MVSHLVVARRPSRGRSLSVAQARRTLLASSLQYLLCPITYSNWVVCAALQTLHECELGDQPSPFCPPASVASTREHPTPKAATAMRADRIHHSAGSDAIANLAESGSSLLPSRVVELVVSTALEEPLRLSSASITRCDRSLLPHLGAYSPRSCWSPPRWSRS